MISVVSCLVLFAPLFISAARPGIKDNPAFFLYGLMLGICIFVALISGIFSGAMMLVKLYKKRGFNDFEKASVAALLVIVLCVAALKITPRALPTGSDLEVFDQAVWKKTGSDDMREEISPRQKMLKDLVKNHLAGKNRAELEAMLGPSMDTEYFRSSGRDLIYPLGRERDMSISVDSEWLLIWLDDKGQYARYKVVND